MLFLVVTIFQTFIGISVLLHFTLVYFTDIVALLFLQIEVHATLHQTKLLAPFSRSIYSLHVFVSCFSNSFDIPCIYIIPQRITSIIRQMLTAMKVEIDSHTIEVGTLTLNLHKQRDNPERKLTRKHKPKMTYQTKQS